MAELSYIGEVDIGVALPFTVQFYAWGTGVPTDSSTPPTYNVIKEDVDAAVVASGTLTIKDDVIVPGQGVGTYYINPALATGSLTSDTYYIIRVAGTVGGNLQNHWLRFYTRLPARKDHMTTVEKAIAGTDAGAANTLAVARREDVTR